MHRRYDHVNIPTELLRTLITIADLNGFTKAGDVLNLTQSAISAQVKRLQQLVGGELFAKSSDGLRLTELGATVAAHGRRMLALNDQILALRGSPQSATLRLGLPNGLTKSLAAELVRRLSVGHVGCNVFFRTDTAENHARGLQGGYIDLALISDPQSDLRCALCEWAEQLYWLKSPSFVLSPGAPIPIVSSPGGLSERYASAILQQRSIPYTVSFSSIDLELRLTAVEAAVGLMVAPLRTKTDGLIVAKDHYLPPLPSIRVGVYGREEADVSRYRKIAATIEAAIRGDPAIAISYDHQKIRTQARA